MPVILDYGLKGEAVYDKYLNNALRKAQKHAKKTGFIASIPQLIHGKIITAQLVHGKIITAHQADLWRYWFTGLSEEDIGVDKDGKFVEKGGYVVITVHGDGILNSPERIEKIYDKKRNGLTGQSAGKLAKKEISDLLHGGLPSGKTIRVFSYDEFLEESKLPDFLLDNIRFAIVRPLELAQKTKSGYYSMKRLHNDSEVIVYSGGKAQAKTLLELMNEKYGTGKIGVWHPFTYDWPEFDPEQAQGRFLFIGYSEYDGINCERKIFTHARFVAVSPKAIKAQEASKRASLSPELTLDNLLLETY